MPVYRFPNLLGVPPEQTPEGVVALGGNLEPQNLVEAYRNGIFPWPISPPEDSPDMEPYPLAWFSPHPRAILDFEVLHVPKSLRRARNQSPFRFSFDQAFEQVIRGCKGTPRAGQTGTWITPEMEDAYIRLHQLGIAHSIEAWKEDELVGGLYGVAIDGAFAGESMFHLAPNASKLALLHLADHLLKRGLTWMDIQMMTPHLKALGAYEITRDEYLLKLSRTRALGLTLF
jgi:leucyl/phenylalanyl-tRNA--protein transferase